MSKFGSTLRYFRQRAREIGTGRPLSQERLAHLLAERLGMDSLSGATISNWERGRYQIHKDDRATLIALIKVLYEYGGVLSVNETSQWLGVGNYRPLDAAERKDIDARWGEESWVTSNFVSVENALPPPTYTRFVGQEVIVQALQEQLISAQGPGVVCIYGLGGMGKTALADTVARRLTAGDRFTQVIWLASGVFPAHMEPDEAVSLLPALLLNALIPESPTPGDPRRYLAQVRYILNSQPHLLVLDDLPSVTSSAGFYDRLQFLSGTSRFLVTARTQPPPEANAYLHAMRALTQKDALELLRYYAGMSGANVLTPETENVLVGIYQVIGGHPLALRLATRLALNYSWAWLLDGWQRDQQGQITHLYENIYLRLWQSLTENEQQLLMTMLLVAQIGAQPEQLQSVSGLAETDFWPTITTLIEKSLLEPRGTTQERRYGIHQLTYQFLRNRLYHSDANKAWHTKHILANLHYWHTLTVEFTATEWHFPAEERYNIYQAIMASLSLPPETHGTTVKPSWHALARCLLTFCQQRGYWHEWLPLLKQLVSANEGVVRAALLNQLGVLYQLAHQLPDAMVAHQEALSLTMHLEDEPGIGHTVANLGRVYYRQRNFAVAAEQAGQALAIFTQQEPHGKEVASSLELLGLAVRAQGDYEAAVKYLGDSAQRWRKLNRPVELARTLNNLGNTWQARGDPEVALRYFAEAKTALTGTDSELDRVMIALSEGTIHFEMGNVAQAGTAFRTIDLAFLRRIGHVLYLGISLNNLGNVCLMEKDYENATAFLRQATEVWQASGEMLQLANSLKTLGDVFRARQRSADAREVYDKAAVLLQQYPNDLWARKLMQRVEDARSQLSHG
ncbi:MAG: tetratricopeptide repeat protein [Ardenticatenales bacterium]|nr:tetratricopeptide repeat protein [Ardenticatenales bacterium]